jgi:hypothetical protein
MIFTYLLLKGIDTSFQQRSAKAKDRDTFILHQFFLTYSLHQITNFVFMKTTLGINQYHRSMTSFIYLKETFLCGEFTISHLIIECMRYISKQVHALLIPLYIN